MKILHQDLDQLSGVIEYMDTENIKQTVDAISMVTVVGTLVDVLPALAAIFTIVWTAIRIYETKTIQKFIRSFKDKEE